MRIGAPRRGREKDTVERIHVSLDGQTQTMLRRLETALGPGVRRGRTSVAVRRAIEEAAERLKG